MTTISANFNSSDPHTTITVGKRKITVRERFAQGDLCDLYHCTYDDLTPPTHDVAGGTRFDRILEDDDGFDIQGVLKVATDVLDNDLVENEAKTLNHLFPPTEKDEKFYRYLPRLVESFQVRTSPKEIRQANLLVFLEGYLSLADIFAAYPKGIDFRDFVWMFKRALVGIGFAHQQEVIHGAMLPSHILVHPVGHGAKIIDWSYAVRGDDRVRAVSRTYADFYPPEVFAKQTPKSTTDIFMIAKCAVALLGGDVKTNAMPDAVPKEIQAFLIDCLHPAASNRPSNAWDLHEEFDKLLLKLVGKPKYRPFTMPTR